MLIEEVLPPSQAFPVGKASELVEDSEIKLTPQQWANQTALKIAVQDIAKGENYLQTYAWTYEWDKADRLYLFRVPAQNWEGTATPRASLGVPLVFEHVESVLPQVMTGLFSDDPPFMSTPRPSTSMQTARAADALLGFFLKGIGFREEIRLLAKSALIYGTGVGKWGWESYEIQRTVYRRKQARKFVPLGMGGVNLNQPKSDEVEEVQETTQVNRPTFEHINLRHLVVDPGARTQDIRKAKWVAHRLYLTVEDVLRLSDYEGYDVPNEDAFKQILFQPKEVPTRSALERSSLNIAQDFKAVPRDVQTTADPAKLPLEVIEYWTHDRVVTIVNRKLVIRNQDNAYGCLPFVSVNFADVLDSFYGLGIAKLVGDEQRMQQGVMNAFLDDLSLTLNGMFIRKRGTNTPTQQMRMRPGGIIDSDDEKGVAIMQRQPIDAGIFGVLATSDSRAQRRTAANELVVQGTLPSQGSSITRTATGVQALTGGSGARLQYLIENIASLVFIPVLDAFHKMIAKNMKPSELEAILSKELKASYQGDVIDIMNARLDFNILAAAKLQSRRAMAQSIPLLYQFILTEPVLNALQQQGKKANIPEMVNMLFDVSGWPNRQDVIQDMSQDDEARAAMANPAVQQMIAQKQSVDQQQKNKMQVIEEENIARAGRDVIREAIKKKEEPAVA
jgi:hypothetical protein